MTRKKPRAKFTDEELEFIREKHQLEGWGFDEIAKALESTQATIRGKVFLMGLNAPGGCISHRVRDEERMREWRRKLDTEEE